jgi:hypothetical protein
LHLSVLTAFSWHPPLAAVAISTVADP